MPKVVKLAIVEGKAVELPGAFDTWLEETRRIYIDHFVRVVSVSAPMPTPQGYAVSVLWERVERPVDLRGRR